MPALQFVQADARAAPLYRPGVHCVHPAAAASAIVPAKHSAQKEEPVSGMAVPPAHAVQPVLPLVEEKRPAAHCSHAAEPAAENVPSPHKAQAVCPVCG